MFKLTYDISLKDNNKEKELIDKIRVKNANLDISCSQQIITTTDL